MAARTEPAPKPTDADIIEALRGLMGIARMTAELLRRYVYVSSLSSEYGDSVERRCRDIEDRLGLSEERK